MSRNSSDPPPDKQNVVLVGAEILRDAEQMIESCEHCNPDADIPFDNLIAWVTGYGPGVTDYLLENPAKCPNCRRKVFEKTLIELA